MKIFEELREDHEKQRSLLKILAETSGDTPARREYFTQLKEQLESHAVAEERYFYSKLMESDQTIDMSRHGIAEHHEIDELIETLENTDMGSSAWLTHLKSLQEKVEHHLADEEQEFFQVAGKVLNEQDKSKLAGDYREEMQKELAKH
ncbi:hemerythrin domain-containing protein [Salinimonas chungwhensis]|uniref:hemerythrin domain-containing protein n=1 Tax=Salinimonas chungwhensis TaxID=265425 RepID=UPI0003659F26|nr:hemerythrin domain-containing protein [Salinimonas chungwhensis]